VQEASRKLTPVKVNGEDTYRAESFVNIYGSREALYGLGQHQAGVWNYRGEAVDMFAGQYQHRGAFSSFKQRITVFSGTVLRAAVSTTALRITCTSVPKLRMSSTIIFSMVPISIKSLPVIASFTRQAPMFGKWAYGFWQCKNRYKTQEEILGRARKYRELTFQPITLSRTGSGGTLRAIRIPTRIIPDPKGMVDELHRDNFHLMISIWPFFEPGSANYDYMKEAGLVCRSVQVRETSVPQGRDGGVRRNQPRGAQVLLGSGQIKDCFSIGLDAWWMDTTEPETEGQEDNIQLGHNWPPAAAIAT